MTGARINRVAASLSVAVACIPRWLAIVVAAVLATAGKGCL
jgi:hypothetical protein